jgi:hypothetical protein
MYLFLKVFVYKKAYVGLNIHTDNYINRCVKHQMELNYSRPLVSLSLWF